MRLFRKLFGKKEKTPEVSGPDGQLVRLHIPLSDGQIGTDEERQRWDDLENLLEKTVLEEGVGDLDGAEIGDGEYTMWLYGRDSAVLAERVKLVCRQQNLPSGCRMYVRHGGIEDDDAPEEIVNLT